MSYIKSLSADFGGTISLENFHNEILAESNITKKLRGVVCEGDNIIINFAESLSAAEQAALNVLIQTHSTIYIPKKITHQTVYPEYRRNQTTKYRVIATFHYPGSDLVGPINYVDFVGKMDTNLSSYDFQVINQIDNTVLAEGNFTNTTKSLNSIDTITNVPTGDSILEVLVKGNGGNKNVEIQEILFYYGN